MPSRLTTLKLRLFRPFKHLLNNWVKSNQECQLVYLISFRYLTEVGREQAEKTGKRIAELYEYVIQSLWITLSSKCPIWQNSPKRASFWQNIFPFTVLSNPNFPKCSVKNVVLSKHSQKCSVKIRWISVKHWWLYWQCAVLSKSAVMFDRTFLAFDRNPVKS